MMRRKLWGWWPAWTVRWAEGHFASMMPAVGTVAGGEGYTLRTSRRDNRQPGSGFTIAERGTRPSFE